jgi:hypothetical protein
MFIAKLNSKGAAAMSNLDLGINEIIGFQVRGTADWRCGKAEQFPNDSRNLKASDELDRLADEIAELDGSDLHRRCIDALNKLEGDADILDELNTSVSVELRGIGFYREYESGAAFLHWYCEEIERLLREHIKDANDIRLAEQVENDEAVKAAKLVYDKAYAKAFAEARKRL